MLLLINCSISKRIIHYQKKSTAYNTARNMMKFDPVVFGEDEMFGAPVSTFFHMIVFKYGDKYRKLFIYFKKSGMLNIGERANLKIDE